MINIKITRNPFLLFLPFLILYLILILIFSINELHGDEGRYVAYAQNLVNGFYSPPAPNIDLGNGPGYPIIIVPFIAFHLPLIYIHLLNAIFYYLSIILLYKSLQQIVSFRVNIIFCLCWAFYPTFYEQMAYVLPEVFASSLIPLLIFTLLKVFNDNDTKKAKYIFFAGFTFGYLALTKPIFGYVLLFMLIGAVLILFTNIKSKNYQKSVTIILIALLTALPYLTYTYHLTGKVFYWSSFGGNNLYWMSTPYEGEYGSWSEFPVKEIRDRIPGSDVSVNTNHQKDFDIINKYKGAQQDDVLKEIAINNIKSHPTKFLINCFSNAGRMLFNFPYNYVAQKPNTLLRLPINGSIMILIMFSLIPTFLNWRKVLFSIRFMLFIGLLYFGGSLLGSADSRMFVMVVPILLLWFAFVLSKSVKIKLKFD